ncbi:MAG: hypothetical protein SGILL_008920, partial [Bacillariaceae sp.]
MPPKNSNKKRKTDDTSAEAKKHSKIASDDENVDSLVSSSRSKHEKKELKELFKNHLIGDKLLNINSDVVTVVRQKVLDNLKEQGLVEVVEEKTITIKGYRLTEKGAEEAAPEEFKDDMARKPNTDEDLHELIKKYSYHPPTGSKIFDTLLEHTKHRKCISKKEL